MGMSNDEWHRMENPTIQKKIKKMVNDLNRLCDHHKGPMSVGRNHPTMEVTPQMITAMIRDLIQPIEYSICNASSHAIPADECSEQSLAQQSVEDRVDYRANKGSEKCCGYTFAFTKKLYNNINYER